MSASRRLCDGSRALSKAFSSCAATGSTGAIWSITRMRPPGCVTRTSSATTSSGRGTWWRVRSDPARSNDAGSNGSCVASPSTNSMFGVLCARRRPCSSSSGTRSTATTSRTWRASANASAPAPLPESSARSSPLGAANRTTFASSSAARASCSAAIRSAVLANRSCVASCIVERLLPRGDRTGGPLLLDLGQETADLGPRGEVELVAAQQGLGGIPLARPLDRGAQLRRSGIRERLECPRLGCAAEAVDRARIVAGAPGPQQRGGVAPELVRDGEGAEVLAEDRDQPGVGRVPAVETVVDRAAERLEQPELVEPAGPAPRQPPPRPGAAGPAGAGGAGGPRPASPAAARRAPARRPAA